ncbi:MAG: sugar transferase [Sedimentisphaerales bacterium]
MRLIIIHRNENCKNDGRDYLRFAVTNHPAANVVFRGFAEYSTGWKEEHSFLHWLPRTSITETSYAIPREWSVNAGDNQYQDKIVTYTNQISLPEHIINLSDKKKEWHVVSNCRFFTLIRENTLERVLRKIDADLIAINADPGLLGERERVRLTIQGNIAGFRRHYADSANICPLPDDWPALLFMKPGVFRKLLTGDSLPVSFPEIIEKCRAGNLKVCAVNAAGWSLDLEKENGLLEFFRIVLEKKPGSKFMNDKSFAIAKDARIIGNVVLGKNIRIGSKSVIAGPTILCDNSVLAEGSIINSSVICSNTFICGEHAIQNRIVIEESQQTRGDQERGALELTRPLIGSGNRFRNWPAFSYARFIKRIADIFAALLVLILFAPLIPFIAAVIKLTSPGSIFYKDTRQGLHGKEFHCLKFRTMITGANRIQEKLRFVSQVDGPQFKMADDPRISMVGRFLRETYIDEIPQFFNVLLGQMSVVGPRPSPESENTLCPFWRDARLSVKPGITGLWQINRTRKPMKDFQEWIHYDVEYVRNLSLMTDLGICWKTARKMIDNFISQF